MEELCLLACLREQDSKDSVRVSIAVMKLHDQKASRGEKCIFGLHFHVISHHQRKLGQELKQDRNLEAGAGAETMKR
jgi:hypothetical protein